MKTIMIGNNKGGTGKTTISTNLAVYIGDMIPDAKILFIGNDKQKNAEMFFGAEHSEKTLTDIYLHETPAKEIIQKTAYQNIDIIPAGEDLSEASVKIITDPDREQCQILKRSLECVQDEYDICIIDNPPDNNICIINVLAVTDEVIIVATPDEYSISGAEQMQKQIEFAKAYNPELVLRGVLMNKFEKTPHGFRVRAKIKQTFEVFSASIRYTKDRLNASTSDRMPITRKSPTCGFSLDLKKFARELLYIK